jgi:hypothetical protein
MGGRTRKRPTRPILKQSPRRQRTPLEEDLRRAFAQLTVAENWLEGAAAKKRRRRFASDPWPEHATISAVLEMVGRVFDLVGELSPRRSGPKPKHRTRGSPGRPQEYTEDNRRNLLSSVQLYLDEQELEGKQPTDAEAVRRYLKATNRYGSEADFKTDEYTHKRRVSYFRQLRRKT